MFRLSARLVVLLTALLATALTAPALSATATAAGTVNPVGVYQGTVTRPGASMPLTLTFKSGGQACLRTSEGLSTGSWTPTGPATFNFKIKEALITNGQQTGWVLINQNAALAGPALASSGVSTLTDLSGKVIGTSPASIAATRNDSGSPC